MEKMIAVLDEIRGINEAYGISQESVEKLQKEMETARVCVPVIGKFSSGKSALINTILGYSNRILKEDITPETAVPAEILYADVDEVRIIKNDGMSEAISVEDFRRLETDAATVRCARLYLNNSFLREIPDVMLVDMPGFESGYEIHNKAIDNYLPSSMAYIVAFPADDMIVRSSVGNILKELCLHDMPLGVVITKYDKRNDDFEVTFEKLKESLRRFVGDREIRFCKTSSFDGDAEELAAFLEEIQEKSQEILVRNFIHSAAAIVENTENYLKTTLQCSRMSESELDEQEEKQQQRLTELEAKFSKEKSDFELGIAECVSEITNDIQCALEAEESRLVAMAINKQNINEQLNTAVRNALTVSIKKRFIPRIERYLKRVEACLNSESVGDIHIAFYVNTSGVEKGITSSIVAAAAGFLLGFPITGVIVGAVMAIGNAITGVNRREQEKQAARDKIRNEVFPQVLDKVEAKVQSAVEKQTREVNKSIETELKNQRDTLEKALLDIREKMAARKEEKENLEAAVLADMERIGELKNELQ